MRICHAIIIFMKVYLAMITERNTVKSESMNELFSALAKAQAEMLVAELSANNPFFKSKYADFTTLVKASRPALTKHGLCVTQVIKNNALLTILGHASGQYIESEIEIKPQKADVQSFGSYITYLKRYSYAAIVGITTGEEDDDGEAAVRNTSGPRQTYTPRIELITPEQYDTLKEALEDTDRLESSIKENLKIDSLEDMPKERYSAALNWINKKKLELAQAGK